MSSDIDYVNGNNKFNQKIETLTRMDTVRISKLLEITQYAFLTFIFAFFIGGYLDKLFYVRDKDTKTYILIRDVALQLFLIIIIAYYIRKLVLIFPFMFSISKDYIPSAKGEAQNGIALALAIIFLTVQPHFQANIDELKRRFI